MNAAKLLNGESAMYAAVERAAMFLYTGRFAIAKPAAFLGRTSVFNEVFDYG